MQQDLTHPVWYADAKVTCACGETFSTGSTIPAIRVEICSKCHPLYTGTQKFVDTLGQVDRFIKKEAESKVKRAQVEQIKLARASRVAETKREKPSLKDLLMQARKQAAS